MHLENISISSNLGQYEVVFTEDNNVSIPSLDPENMMMVIDRNVWDKYKSSALINFVNHKKIILDVSEEMKTLHAVMNLYDEVMQYAPKKNMTLLSIGGGITQDVTGFVASTLYRGIRWVYVPTTVLAQADSCIGSKTSLNYGNYKNLLGTFFPPRMVIINTAFTDSLTTIDYFSGLGEVVKLHLLGEQHLLDELLLDLDALMNRDQRALTSAIYRSLKIKKGYIEDDEFDGGKRNLLNYGHCFGHAIESAVQYAIPHGQAVVVGMMMANEVAMRRGEITPHNKQRLEQELFNPLIKFEWELINHIAPEKVVEAMGKDKKRTGSDLALILPSEKKGMNKINDLKKEEALDVVRHYRDKDFKQMI